MLGIELSCREMRLRLPSFRHRTQPLKWDRQNAAPKDRMQTMLTHFFAEITFFELGMTLIALGVIERLLYLLPRDVVGPGGWLLDTGAADDKA